MKRVFFYFFIVVPWVCTNQLYQDCSMTLGQFGQGFDIECIGGQDQIDLFTRHLREKVLLPTVIKMALKTDLCGISDQIQKYGKGSLFFLKKVNRYCDLFWKKNQFNSCIY